MTGEPMEFEIEVKDLAEILDEQQRFRIREMVLALTGALRQGAKTPAEMIAALYVALDYCQKRSKIEGLTAAGICLRVESEK